MAKQKRSENTYQKINSIFKRDINNIIMPYDGFTLPELEWMRPLKFSASEKIDGTNMRIEIKPCLLEEDGRVVMHVDLQIKGKTDNAEIPKLLKAYMEHNFISSDDKGYQGMLDNYLKVIAAFGYDHSIYEATRDTTGLESATIVDEWTKSGFIEKTGSHDMNGRTVNDYRILKQPSQFTIYGEGYGKGIQKAGPHYIKDGVSFIGFDVKWKDPNTGKEMYLNNENRDDIFNKIGIPSVPDMGMMTIDEAIEFVKKGFTSAISEEKDFPAEGLVLKTPDGLRTRQGERIIFKVKTNDFKKYFNKYGTYDKVEQTPNPNY